MKRYIYIIALALALSGCGKWLDAPRPMGQDEERDLYKTEQGFRNVLTGVYIGMSQNELYGKNITLVYPEMMVQHWTTKMDTPEWAAHEFNFENTELKKAINDMWLKAYKQIVNVNSLLANIDAKRGLFTQDNFNLVKGEALGLRGFLHLDILRMWGPVPKGADQQKLCIPYVTEVTRQLDPLAAKPYGKVVELILKDLDEAEKLLVNDPITKYTYKELEKPLSNAPSALEDEFYYFRHSRMNLYAVKAAKARLYMWIGDHANAAKYAAEVIDGQVKEGAVFTLADGTYVDNNKAELTFKTEHVFSLFRNNYADMFLNLYKAQGTLQQIERDKIDLLYNATDIRRPDNFWESDQGDDHVNYYTFKKFITSRHERTEVAAKYIPLMRLAEMHLIATECAAQPFNQSLMEKYFEPFLIARNLGSDLMNSMVDEASTMAALEKEWRKEFYGEGQMFFYYKRLGTERFTFPRNMDVDPLKYVVPKPDNQIMFE